ncbi:MAG: ornithine carbamoyltransferase [Candidatus Latescibacterota bacterium]
MHLATLKDWSAEDIQDAIQRSLEVKRNPQRYARAMAGRTLGMLFQKTSTRTRCAGEVGMTQLGGHAMYMDWRHTNFSLADLGDEIRVLSRYADLLVLRLLEHRDVLRATEVSEVPVMNGCCNRYHPMQALTDLMTIQEVLGRLEGVRLAYVGVLNNVCNSLIAGGMKCGVRVIAVTPESNPAAEDAELYRQAQAAGLLEHTDDLCGALRRADVVYTDTWIDMEFFADPAYQEEKERRMRLFGPYQLNRGLLAGLDVRIMHCLPAHRGYEIEGELLDDPRSIVFTQAENRMHNQKALILKLAGQ